MKKTNKLISILLVLAMLLSMAPLSLTASAASGTCGPNATWSLNNGVLTISGSGAMNDYESNNDLPWYSDIKNIKKAVVESGITRIGTRSFYYHTKLQTVEIKGNPFISDYAFTYCDELSNVVFGGTVDKISGWKPFQGCSALNSFTLREGVGQSNDSFSGDKNVNVKLVDAAGNDKTAYYSVSVEHNTSNRNFMTIKGNLEKGSINAIPDQYYTGGAIQPAVTVNWNGQTLGSNCFNVSYSNNVELGIATVTLTGKGNYTGTLTQTFNIVNKDFTGIYAEDVYPVYDLEPHGITVTGAPEGATITYSLSETGPFTEEQPAIINVSDSGDIYYKVSAPGYNDYIGNAGVYILYKNIADCNIYILESPSYTGGYVIPNYKVIYDTGHGEYTLNQDTDYTETVSSVITGNGSITVTGTGNFYGTLTAEYTVQPAEIPLAEITLGEFGTYNGSEQTQTVEAVKFNGVTLVEGRDYVVTGNTATEAGTYTLTITGIGNVTGTITKEWKINPRPVTVTITNTSKIYGEADPALDFTVSEEKFKSSLAGEIVRTPGENVGVYAITQNTLTNENNPNFDITFIDGKFTIEPDKSGIEGLTIENVKSSDKENVEYVYNQLENAVKDLADEDKISEWNTLQSYCAAMRQRIEIVENQIKAFENKLSEYDIDTVTSDDTAYLESFQNSVGNFYNDYYDNLTDEQIKKVTDIYSAIEDLETRISDVAKEITRITDAVNGYDEATVKYGDYKDILQLIDDIEALTTGKNITDFERADLEELNAKANLLAAKIRSTADEISRITRAVNAYSIDTVKSSDKADIENLIARIRKLTDGDNITDDERANLNELDSILDALLAKIDETADEITRITNAVNSYDEATVKSSDKTDLEQLKEDIKALADGQNITADERAKLENLDATADALLAKIAETTAEYDRVIAAANGYDEATVTSADKEALVQLNNDIYALALTDNVTEEEKENLQAAHDKVLGLIDKLTDISDEIKRIIEAVDKYVFESVKSSDKADIVQLIADIKILLDTHNITADERTLLSGANETCTKLIEKIDETVAEINRINDATNAYDIDTVTSADKADVEKLLADIKALTDGDNVTDAEREQLNGNEATLKALLDKIGATADEIARIETAVNGYDEETVKSTDKADLEQLKADIKTLTDATNVTEDERTKLGELDAKIDALIKKIDDTAAEIERIDEAVNGYDKETVTSDDVPELGKLIEDIKTLTDGDNLTEDEKGALEETEKAIDDLVEKLAEVAEEIKKVDEAVKSYDEETVKSTDSEDLAQLKEEIQSLIDSDNTTENEKSALEEMIKDIEGLEDKIDETAKEIERIENAVNDYDEETVKSSDEEAIEQLKEDIQKLIDSGNVTEEEIAGLEETKADADALTDKIDETQAEIDRINDAVAGYDKETVKSTDSEDLAQLKEEIQSLIDSDNTTENEKTALEEMIKDIEGLEDKIAETEEKLEEIKNIENNFNPETVSSDDKAAIEDKIAEIEAVNPDNLTDEQKAEYEEIKAGFEALLDKIEEASKAVTDIAVELEMFDEERVTKFWEDDIEALKAKIDELLADENMGEAEKAKLGEYKAQAEKLIEIINTPKEYISCRFFYLIWDCLTWKYNGILWLFSKIFAC